MSTKSYSINQSSVQITKLFWDRKNIDADLDVLEEILTDLWEKAQKSEREERRIIEKVKGK